MSKTKISLLLVFLLATVICTESKGKLKQASHSSIAEEIFTKMGEGFIQLGNAQQIQKSNGFILFVVTFGALFTVLCMCVLSQCVVEHAKKCQKQLNEYHEEEQSRVARSSPLGCASPQI